MGGLCGCGKLMPPSNDISQSEDYKSLHPANVQDIGEGAPQVQTGIDITTGKAFNVKSSGKRLDLDKIPTPTSTKIITDDPNQELSEGERQPGWTGLYDIYWKLNWIRKELLDSNVPNNLGKVVVRTRKHCQRIHKDFSDRSIDKFLDIANEALDHLDKGLDHMATTRLLTRANISWRSLPWSASENEVQRWLENQGALPSSQVSASSSRSDSEDEDGSTRNRFVPKHVTSSSISRFVGSDTRKGAMLALDYAHQYHHSPLDEARKEFEAALRDILRLRDKMELQYARPSVPGDSFLIIGDLHEEPGGFIDRPDHYSPTNMDQSTHPGSSSNAQIP